ncbi:unnamed protein product [Caenorhabditis angaria]|uniref:Uncharacterized protein n=1 Tax=Caenorhabditis angaria TaxID=860376 RepID=A0A9P1IV77_9PELO|nr:unnamed protein product [Caenorhabditis angaria]
MNFNSYLLALLIVLAQCCFVFSQNWEGDLDGSSFQYQQADPVEQRFLSYKRSIDDKIRSLKERNSNGQFKNILFG